MRPGTAFFEGALRASWLSSGTGGSAKKNQLKTEITPGAFGDNSHQIELDFHRIFVFSQSQPS